MANKIFYYSVLVCMILFTSCDKSETKPVNGNAFPVIITAQSIGYETDSPATSYQPNTCIGVSMVEAGTENTYGNGLNVRYIYEGAGNYFFAANSDSTLFLPDNGNKMDISAYYPYLQSSNISENKVDINILESCELPGVLQFAKVAGVSKDIRNADLKLKPVFAKLTVNIDPTTVNGTSATVALKETFVKGNFNILNGVLTATESGEIQLSNTTTTRNDTPQSLTYETFVFPSTSYVDTGAAMPKLSINILKEDGSSALQDPITIASGDFISNINNGINTTFDITINSDGTTNIKVKNELFSIDEWTDNNGIEVSGGESL